MGAKTKGQISLFTTCKRCGLPGQYYRDSSWTCKDCVLKRNEAWRQANMGKVLAAQKTKYHGKTEEEKAQRKLAMRARRVGITVEQLVEMDKNTGGKCAICGAGKSKGKNGSELLYLDHCHKSGKARALLCHSCNSMLGGARDSIEILERAIAFLKEHQ